MAAQATPLGRKGVEIIAVQAATVEGTALSRWVEENKIPFKTGILSGDIDKSRLAWGAASLPHLILADQNHTVTAEGLSWSDLDRPIEAAASR